MSKLLMLNGLLIILLTIFWLFAAGNTYGIMRTELMIPDIPGYLTLKCDFHMHTVFSDGSVWPQIRPEEAWCEGLDAISITDHIEVQPHKKDVPTNHNRPYELGISRANSLNIIMIRGAEITRDMPPGHYNAIFLKDVNPLDTPDWRDSIKAAIDQGAFIFWNHPGWPAGKSIWYPEHEELYKKGWMHGIEIVNEKEYYPEAFQWCLDKNLTIMGNSDVHGLSHLDWDAEVGERKPVTLVFAKERTEQGIREALDENRTAVYWNNSLYGKEEFLRPIFEASVDVINPNISIKGKSSAYVQLRNKSDVPFELVMENEGNGVSAPKSVKLYPHRTILLPVSGTSNEESGKKNIGIPYRVKNLLINPENGLPVEISLSIEFRPSEK